MSITVTGRKMPVTDALREYAEEKIGNSMKVMDIDPLVAEVVLFVEKNPANPRPAVCEVTLRTKGHSFVLKNTKRTCTRPSTWPQPRWSASCASTRRRVVDRKLRAADETIRMAEPAAAGELDVDGLMRNLPPMTKWCA